MTNHRRITIATAFLAGGALTLGLAFASTDEEVLPPCATEDSANCYWDADTQGDGTGTDFVDLDGTAYYPEEPEVPAEEPPAEPSPIPEAEVIEEPTPAPEPAAPVIDPNARQDYDTGTLECGVNAKPAIDQDAHGNWWAYCEPALVD